MNGLLQLNSSLQNGVISSEGSDETIRNTLLEQKNIVLLKHVFSKDLLSSIKTAVHAWGQATAISPAQTMRDDNFHSFESGISPRQKTLHQYHAYNFNQILNLPADLKNLLMAVFEPMRQFQNRLTGQNAQWQLDASGKKLHPQVIHYPCGGGMFAAHVHPLLPQQLGLILSISQRGVDFDCGGAGFELPDGSLVDTASEHEQSDLLMFRYDLRHWVSLVNPEEALDRNSIRGRWVMVLPYY